MAWWSIMGIKRGLASMLYKFLDKVTSVRTVKNENIGLTSCFFKR